MLSSVKRGGNITEAQQYINITLSTEDSKIKSWKSQNFFNRSYNKHGVKGVKYLKY